MALNKRFQRAVSGAFRRLSSFAVEGVHRVYTGYDRDPDTYQIDPKKNDYSIKGLLSEFQQTQELQEFGPVSLSDKKFLVHQDGAEVEIQTGHSVIIDGVEYRIEKLKYDQLSGVYILLLRLK